MVNPSQQKLYENLIEQAYAFRRGRSAAKTTLKVRVLQYFLSTDRDLALVSVPDTDVMVHLEGKKMVKDDEEGARKRLKQNIRAINVDILISGYSSRFVLLWVRSKNVILLFGTDMAQAIGEAYKDSWSRKPRGAHQLHAARELRALLEKEADRPRTKALREQLPSWPKRQQDHEGHNRASMKTWSHAGDLPSNYVSRTRDREKAKRLLLKKHSKPSDRIVVLNGFAGIGKTTLVQELCQDSEVQKRFPDGLIHLSLRRSSDVESAQLELANKLGVLSLKSNNLDDARNLLTDKLVKTNALIVLDDAGSSEIVRMLGAPGPSTRFLVTTRDGDLRGQIEGPGFKLQDSKSLAHKILSYWIGIAVRSLPNPARDVANACGYVPLAISIAASLHKNAGMSWEALLAELKAHRFGTYKHRPFGSDYHYDCLNAAIQVSVEMLSAKPHDCGALLDSLCIFPEDVVIPKSVLAMYWRRITGKAIPATWVIHELERYALARQMKPVGLLLHDAVFDFLQGRNEGQIKRKHADLISAYEERQQNTGDWVTVPDDGYFFQWFSWHCLKGEQAEPLFAATVNSSDWVQRSVGATDQIRYSAQDIHRCRQLLATCTNPPPRSATRLAAVQYALRFIASDLATDLRYLVACHKHEEALVRAVESADSPSKFEWFIQILWTCGSLGEFKQEVVKEFVHFISMCDTINLLPSERLGDAIAILFSNDPTIARPIKDAYIKRLTSPQSSRLQCEIYNLIDLVDSFCSFGLHEECKQLFAEFGSSPHPSALTTSLARNSIYLGNHEEARQRLLKLPLDEDTCELHSLLNESLFKAGKEAFAVENLNELLEIVLGTDGFMIRAQCIVRISIAFRRMGQANRADAMLQYVAEQGSRLDEMNCSNAKYSELAWTGKEVDYYKMNATLLYSLADEDAKDGRIDPPLLHAIRSKETVFQHTIAALPCRYSEFGHLDLAERCLEICAASSNDPAESFESLLALVEQEWFLRRRKPFERWGIRLLSACELEDTEQSTWLQEHTTTIDWLRIELNQEPEIPIPVNKPLRNHGRTSYRREWNSEQRATAILARFGWSETRRIPLCASIGVTEQNLGHVYQLAGVLDALEYGTKLSPTLMRSDSLDDYIQSSANSVKNVINRRTDGEIAIIDALMLAGEKDVANCMAEKIFERDFSKQLSLKQRIQNAKYSLPLAIRFNKRAIISETLEPLQRLFPSCLMEFQNGDYSVASSRCLLSLQELMWVVWELASVELSLVSAVPFAHSLVSRADIEELYERETLQLLVVLIEDMYRVMQDMQSDSLPFHLAETNFLQARFSAASIPKLANLCLITLARLHCRLGNLRRSSELALKALVSCHWVDFASDAVSILGVAPKHAEEVAFVESIVARLDREINEFLELSLQEDMMRFLIRLDRLELARKLHSAGESSFSDMASDLAAAGYFRNDVNFSRSVSATPREMAIAVCRVLLIFREGFTDKNRQAFSDMFEILGRSDEGIRNLYLELYGEL